MKSLEDIKSIKFGRNMLFLVNMFLSVLFIMTIDGLSTFDMILYGGVLSGLWYVVKMMDDKVKVDQKTSDQTTN